MDNRNSCASYNWPFSRQNQQRKTASNSSIFVTENTPKADDI